MPATLQELVPLLFVEDIVRSAAFYQHRLGFEMTLKWEPKGKLSWCRLERGGAALMLQQALPEEDGPAEGRGRGVGFYFNCDDAAAMHADLASRGLSVRCSASVVLRHEPALRERPGWVRAVFSERHRTGKLSRWATAFPTA
jgi:uncharacterized glyoxalase superfamily protein PhnB